MMTAELNLDKIKNYSRSLYKKEIRCEEARKNLIEYNKLSMRVRSVMIAKGHFKEGKQKEIKKLLRHPLLRNESKAISFPATIKFHSMLSDIFIFMNDWKKSFIQSEKVIQLMNEQPAFLKTKIDFYLIRISNMVGLMSQLRKEKELAFYMNKVKTFVEALPKKMQTENIYRVYTEINTNYIDYLLSTFQFPEALRQSKAFEPSVKKYHNPPHFIIFHFNFCLAYFYSEDFHSALKEANRVLALDEEGILRDIINAGKLLNILIHYELGNEELIPSLCKSAQRYLEKKGELKQGAKLLLSFFGKPSFYEKSGKEKIKLLGALKTELEKHRNEKVFELFDFSSWLEAKINSSPLAEAKKKNASLYTA